MTVRDHRSTSPPFPVRSSEGDHARRPRRPSPRRTLKRVARRLSSPAALLLLFVTLVATGYRTWVFIADRQLEQRLAVPKVWDVTELQLPRAVHAQLVTRHEDGFLHYSFVVTPADADPTGLEETVNSVTFALQLMDEDGFPVIVLRPSEPLTPQMTDNEILFRVEDVMGCSKLAYAGVTTWAVEWQGT